MVSTAPVMPTASILMAAMHTGRMLVPGMTDAIVDRTGIANTATGPSRTSRAIGTVCAMTSESPRTAATRLVVNGRMDISTLGKTMVDSNR
jgi:hypothetical protein